MHVADGRLVSVSVVRGAPCGATWDAARQLVGERAEEAVRKIGLLAQFSCSADPAGWDPIYGKSPVHFAGIVHSKALARAIAAADKTDQSPPSGDTARQA